MQLIKPGRIPKEWLEWPLSKLRNRNVLTLRSFLYLNDRELDSLVVQMGGMKPKRHRKQSFKVSSTGFENSWERQDSSDPFSSEEKISFLLKELTDRSMISGERPIRSPKAPLKQPPLVHEFCEARSFLISSQNLPSNLGLNALRIWVSEPNPDHFSDEDFDWSGSYLILTELHFDKCQYSCIISGCSALRFIANALSNRPLFYNGESEILGRWDERSFTDKLMSLGARPGEIRRIETMYRIRYMTDEQWHPQSGNGRRVHDIVGYPLFIAI